MKDINKMEDIKWLLDDCKLIAEEIKENELKIKFYKVSNNNFTAKNKLLMYDKKGRIIVTKDYYKGPDYLEFTYKNGVFK